MRGRCRLLAVAVPLAVAPAAHAQAAAPVIPAEYTVPLYRRAWVRPLASLVVPGSGQMLARQGRGLVYLASEVWFVARALALASEGRREREHFQSLAFTVARRRFATARRDGPFSYYEDMSHFVESGAFDADPAPGIQPETDTATFNGTAWLLARRTFFEHPDSIPPPSSPVFEAALAFYAGRAVRDEFRWSWRDARLEQDVFRTAIRTSDEAFRAATSFLGAIVLNHVASAVDALITYRTGGRAAVPRLSVTDAPPGVRLLWHAAF